MMPNEFTTTPNPLSLRLAETAPQRRKQAIPIGLRFGCQSFLEQAFRKHLTKRKTQTVPKFLLEDLAPMTDSRTTHTWPLGVEGKGLLVSFLSALRGRFF